MKQYLATEHKKSSVTTEYNLICGDCLEYLKELPDRSIDLILCDPPYGTTYADWDTKLDFNALFTEYKRIIKPNHIIAIFGTEPFSSSLRVSQKKLYKYDWLWLKKSVTGH